MSSLLHVVKAQQIIIQTLHAAVVSAKLSAKDNFRVYWACD